MYDRLSDERIPLLSSSPKGTYDARGSSEDRSSNKGNSVCDVDCSRQKEAKPEDRKARNAIIACIIIALLFMAAEFVGGYLANSIAIFSDALHMLSDIAGLLLSLVGMVMGNQTASDRFTFGYKRFEIVSSLLSILLIWAMAAVLVYTSIGRLVHPPEVDGEIMLIVACIGMLSNFVMMGVLHFGGAGHAHGGHGHSHGGGKEKSHGHSHGLQHQNVQENMDVIVEVEPPVSSKGHGHSHSKKGHSHQHHGLSEKDQVTGMKNPKTTGIELSKGHGHSHGGKKCTGHNKNKKDEDIKQSKGSEKSKGHGHSHGGKKCTGHNKNKKVDDKDINQPQGIEKSKGHGHSHGGKKCTGHKKNKNDEDKDVNPKVPSNEKVSIASKDSQEGRPDDCHSKKLEDKLECESAQKQGNNLLNRNLSNEQLKSKGKGHGHSHGSEKSTGHSKKGSEKRAKGHGHSHSHQPGTQHAHAHGAQQQDQIEESRTDLQADGKRESHGHAHSSNINVRSAMIHVMGDLLQNIGVIIAAAFIWSNPDRYRIVDPICTLLFAILTVCLSIRVIRDAVEVLMDMSPRDIDIEMIKSRLCKIPGVTGVHDLHCWFMAYGEKSLSCHILVNEDASGSVCTQGVLVQAQAVLQNFEIGHTTIQVEDPDHKPRDHSALLRTPSICV